LHGEPFDLDVVFTHKPRWSNLLRGAASLITFAARGPKPDLRQHTASIDNLPADADLLASDWIMVGDDMTLTMHREAAAKELAGVDGR